MSTRIYRAPRESHAVWLSDAQTPASACGRCGRPLSTREEDFQEGRCDGPRDELLGGLGRLEDPALGDDPADEIQRDGFEVPVFRRDTRRGTLQHLVGITRAIGASAKAPREELVPERRDVQGNAGLSRGERERERYRLLPPS